ncbi:hypothetical protein MCOR25_004068 [Pyricularia grisea]|nr:hypothetical protein MCOR25_004068 [Pyricularia grisea]
MLPSFSCLETGDRQSVALPCLLPTEQPVVWTGQHAGSSVPWILLVLYLAKRITVEGSWLSLCLSYVLFGNKAPLTSSCPNSTTAVQPWSPAYGHRTPPKTRQQASISIDNQNIHNSSGETVLKQLFELCRYCKTSDLNSTRSLSLSSPFTPGDYDP